MEQFLKIRLWESKVKDLILSGGFRGVARAATGRDRIVKMEGSYHGHHDCVLFSVVPESDALGTKFNVSGDSADAHNRLARRP